MVKDWKLKEETEIEALPRADVEALLSAEATGIDVHHGDETLVETKENPSRVQISRPRLRDLGVGTGVLSFRVEVGVPRPVDRRFYEENELPLSDELRGEMEDYADGEGADGDESAFFSEEAALSDKSEGLGPKSDDEADGGGDDEDDGEDDGKMKMTMDLSED